MTARRSALALADWRRRVAELYHRVRRADDPARAWRRFCAERDRLFERHPQSPLTAAQRARFQGLRYFPYDPAWRVRGRVEEIKTPPIRTVTVPEGPVRLAGVARVSFEGPEGRARLWLYWIEGYGGGLFLPFKDATNGVTTYGGGRYLYDTIKGADLGVEGERLVLDFNYAYNPSCAYHPRWVCPLAPAENALPFAVEAGERSFA